MPPLAVAPATTGDLEQARQLFKALADPVRLEVVQALGGGERCVCELSQGLGLAQSRLSFHLKVMRQSGLITAREEGRWVYYKLVPQAFEQLQEWLNSLKRLSQERAQGCS
jgi:ArsR family transcriptional regulator